MSSVELVLDATLRKEQGKGASRRLRRAKKIPAILYGADADVLALTLDEEQVLRLMREEAFFSQILDVKVKGRKTEQAVLKDLQRHPFKPLVSHMDLQRIKEGEAMRVHLPIHFLNQETAKGVKQGGVVHHDMIEIEVECLPKDLPEYIELDIAELDLDQAVHLSEITVPEEVTILALAHDPEQDPAVVSIHTPRKAIEEEEEEAAEEAAAVEEAAAEEEAASGEGGEAEEGSED